MGRDLPDFNAESPLDKISRSRTSLNSTASRQSSYILDAFPISPDLHSLPHQSSQSQESPTNNDVDFDWGFQPQKPRERLIDRLQLDSSHQYSAPPRPARPPHHGPSNSWDGTSQQLTGKTTPHHSTLAWKNLSERNHQNGHHASVTLPQQSVVEMSWTPEQRIQLGAAAIDVNPAMALAHWEISAKQGHKVAPLLYELAQSQWGEDCSLVHHSTINSVDATELKNHVPRKLLPRVAQALFTVGIGELKKHNELQALKSYELAGNLGSPEGMCAAASMYMRGGRQYSRDVIRARHLYREAGVK